jgi:hypothetical protein
MKSRVTAGLYVLLIALGEEFFHASRYARAADRFTSGAEQHDDITLLVMKLIKT